MGGIHLSSNLVAIFISTKVAKFCDWDYCDAEILQTDQKTVWNWKEIPFNFMFPESDTLSQGICWGIGLIQNGLCSFCLQSVIWQDVKSKANGLTKICGIHLLRSNN